MINLVYNDSEPKRIALTLKDKFCCEEDQEIAFVFKVTNRQTGFQVIFTAPDVSVAPSRYESFFLQAISDPDNEDLLNGIFYVPQPGFYDYVVYVVPFTLPQDLDISNPIAKAEVGFLRVLQDSDNVFYNTSQPIIPAFQ